MCDLTRTMWRWALASIIIIEQIIEATDPASWFDVDLDEFPDREES